MTGSLQPLIQSRHPATFAERGVALPTTTPLLSGARGRPGARGDLDLLIPNPTRGRGTYILPWSGIGAFCRPTLHERLAVADTVSPAAVRDAAGACGGDGRGGAARRSVATRRGIGARRRARTPGGTRRRPRPRRRSRHRRCRSPGAADRDRARRPGRSPAAFGTAPADGANPPPGRGHLPDAPRRAPAERVARSVDHPRSLGERRRRRGGSCSGPRRRWRCCGRA